MRLMNFFTAFSFFCGFTIGCACVQPACRLFLGYASATAVAAWANIVLGAWALLVAVIAVIAALLAVAVLFGCSPGWLAFCSAALRSAACCPAVAAFAFCCLLPCWAAVRCCVVFLS